MSQPEHFKVYAAVYIFLIRDGKIFLVRRFNTGWADGQFTVPAGHIEENETPTAAAVREAREESGVEIEEKDLRAVGFMFRKTNRTYADFIFVAESWNVEPHNAEPAKCDLAEWHDLNILPDNIAPYIRQMIENYKKNQLYSVFGWD